MRELKFRAWDKKRKCYAKHIQTLNTSCPYHDRMNMPKGIMTFSKWLLRRYIIEQYTGLKDKNGKEICEGDVVRWVDDYDENAYINFEEGCFWVNWLINSERINGDMVDDLEVIGNIHENANLLEEEK